ncbi:MAG: TadE/TadG family type IV pilus assembly protein, partial [Actinomycetes bacterium]
GRRIRDDDRGSAIVEFTLVGVLLTVLFLALLQLGLALHVRNTLTASAAEGARYAANADRAPAEGAAVTRRLIRDSLADSFADDVTGGFESVGGVPTVYVRVESMLPLVGLLGPPRGIVVRGHALEEAS